MNIKNINDLLKLIVASTHDKCYKICIYTFCNNDLSTVRKSIPESSKIGRHLCVNIDCFRLSFWNSIKP